MKYRKLDANADYTFGNGNANFWQDTPETVAQAVLTRLKLWSAEWFLDIDEGTPYQAGVLGTVRRTEADITIRDRILTTSGVTGLPSFSSTLNAETRTYAVAAIIDTIYGTAQLNEIL